MLYYVSLWCLIYHYPTLTSFLIGANNGQVKCVIRTEGKVSDGVDTRRGKIKSPLNGESWACKVHQHFRLRDARARISVISE